MLVNYRRYPRSRQGHSSVQERINRIRSEEVTDEVLNRIEEMQKKEKERNRKAAIEKEKKLYQEHMRAYEMENRRKYGEMVDNVEKAMANLSIDHQQSLPVTFNGRVVSDRARGILNMLTPSGPRPIVETVRGENGKDPEQKIVGYEYPPFDSFTESNGGS